MSALPRPADNRERHPVLRFTGKELDEETGLYYYGARYLDPRVSRWLSADPALGEYIPSAPINEEARRRNGNLPGMGGVFNYVNLHAYHYAGNNPVRYIDPDGRLSKDEIIKAENQTKAKLADVINSPGKYIIKSFVRKAFVAYPGNRGNVFKHSFYTITNTESDEILH